MNNVSNNIYHYGCWENTTSRRGIRQLVVSFGSIFLLFFFKGSRGGGGGGLFLAKGKPRPHPPPPPPPPPRVQEPREIPGPNLLMTALNNIIVLFLISNIVHVVIILSLSLTKHCEASGKGLQIKFKKIMSRKNPPGN